MLLPYFFKKDEKNPVLLLKSDLSMISNASSAMSI